MYGPVRTVVLGDGKGDLPHNQAIRALGRHLCRVIFKMLTQERPYRIDP